MVSVGHFVVKWLVGATSAIPWKRVKAYFNPVLQCKTNKVHNCALKTE